MEGAKNMGTYILKDIDENLWRKVKSYAALQGISIKELILELLEEEIERLDAEPEPGTMQPPSGGCSRCGAYSNAPYRVLERKLSYEHGSWYCEKCIEELDDEEWADEN